MCTYHKFLCLIFEKNSSRSPLRNQPPGSACIKEFTPGEWGNVPEIGAALWVSLRITPFTPAKLFDACLRRSESCSMVIESRKQISDDRSITDFCRLRGIQLEVCCWLMGTVGRMFRHLWSRHENKDSVGPQSFPEFQAFLS